MVVGKSISHCRGDEDPTQGCARELSYAINNWICPTTARESRLHCRVKEMARGLRGSSDGVNLSSNCWEKSSTDGSTGAWQGQCLGVLQSALMIKCYEMSSRRQPEGAEVHRDLPVRIHNQCLTPAEDG